MFQEFPKMARLYRECVITEKIDGTNAQVFIEYENALPPYDASDRELFLAKQDGLVMLAGSRTRWITPTDDNAGFAKFVQANAEALFKLGPGRHYGEWWGNGIQRGYGLPNGDKRFSLFNVGRWGVKCDPPACCSIVPVLYRGTFSTSVVQGALEILRAEGSKAAPFLNPEGIVVFHEAARIGFKVTLEKDDQPKSRVA